MMVYNSSSAKQTQDIAAQIAKRFKKQGGVVALIGDLGAGKTTFTQGFAQALGITDKIISPTFVLIRQHQLPWSGKVSERMLFHVDLYRLEGKIAPKDLGLAEMFEDTADIVLIEWAEKISDFLPKNTLTVKLEKTSDLQRKISLV